MPELETVRAVIFGKTRGNSPRAVVIRGRDGKSIHHMFSLDEVDAIARHWDSSTYATGEPSDLFPTGSWAEPLHRTREGTLRVGAVVS